MSPGSFTYVGKVSEVTNETGLQREVFFDSPILVQACGLTRRPPVLLFPSWIEEVPHPVPPVTYYSFRRPRVGEGWFPVGSWSGIEITSSGKIAVRQYVVRVERGLGGQGGVLREGWIDTPKEGKGIRSMCVYRTWSVDFLSNVLVKD